MHVLSLTLVKVNVRNIHLKIVGKPLNVIIDIHLCTSMLTHVYM